MSEELEQFLQAEVEAGAVESHGRITISLDKALEKLGRYQLSSAHAYLIKLVQAAQSGGATQVNLRHSEQHLSLEYDGPGYSHQELAELYHALLAGKCPRHLKHLAVGLNAARQVARAPVELISWTLGGATRLTLDLNGSFSVEPCQLPFVRGTRHRITLRIPGPSPTSRLLGLVGLPSRPPEYKILHATCRQAGIPLLWNDEPINGYFEGSRGVLNGGIVDLDSTWEVEGGFFLLSTSEDRRDLLPGLTSPAGGAFTWVAGSLTDDSPWQVLYQSEGLPAEGAKVPQSLERYTMQRFLCAKLPACACEIVGRRTPLQSTSVSFVHDGAVLETIDGLSLPPGFHLTVSTGHLSTDLTGLSLVRDETFEIVLSRLRNLLEMLLKYRNPRAPWAE